MQCRYTCTMPALACTYLTQNLHLPTLACTYLTLCLHYLALACTDCIVYNICLHLHSWISPGTAMNYSIGR